MKKYCYSCKKEKNFDSFYKNKLSKDGLFKKCKTCSKQATIKRQKEKTLSRSVLLKPKKGEIFKKHKSGLLVSNFGNIFIPENSFKGRVNASKNMRKTLMANGYYTVSYGVGNRPYVHRLVAETFIENRNNKKCVNHKDFNKLNNNANNLEWCSNIDNLKHATLNDRHANKLNRHQVLEIRKSKESTKELSKKYSVSQTNIRLILNRKIWKHI